MGRFLSVPRESERTFAIADVLPANGKGGFSPTWDTLPCTVITGASPPSGDQALACGAADPASLRSRRLRPAGFGPWRKKEAMPSR